MRLLMNLTYIQVWALKSVIRVSCGAILGIKSWSHMSKRKKHKITKIVWYEIRTIVQNREQLPKIIYVVLMKILCISLCLSDEFE